MPILEQLVAKRISLAISKAIHDRTPKEQQKITNSSLCVSYALHLALEAIATELEVDKEKFKIACGVGQPLAYFV
jgi:hypothetical protein